VQSWCIPAHCRMFTSISRTAHLLMSRATSTTTPRPYRYNNRRQVSRRKTPTHTLTENPLQDSSNCFVNPHPAQLSILPIGSPLPKCLPGTREELLNEVKRWIDLDQTKICWIHGPAGAGKSATAQTVSETCSERRQLAATFFFSRSAPSRSHAQWFFTTIAHQIAHSMPQMRRRIL